MNVLHKLRRLFPKRSRRIARRANSWGGKSHVVDTQLLEDRTMLTVDYIRVADSLDAELVTMQNRLTIAVNGLQTGATSHIPIVGDQLGRAANIVSSFRTEMREALETFGTTTPTTSQLQSALAEHLGSFLGLAGPAGVHVSDTGDTTTIEMILQGSAVLDEVDISFDTGLPSLPISFTSNGSLELSVGFALEVAFTINDTTGVVDLINGTRNLTGVTAPDASHPLVDNDSDLALFVSAGPSSDFNAKAVFGFVEGFATLLPGEPNGLYATVLVSDLLGTPSLRIDGSADANLQLAGSFAGTSDDFPGISTDFHFHWGLSSADPSFGAPTVSFDNVSLTFGTFLSNVLRPSLKPIKDALDPLSPVLTLLTTEVPGISDLSESAGAGPIRVLDLAVAGSNLTGNGPLGELAGKITDLLAKIDSIQIGNNISLPLGGFDLNSTTNGDLRKAVIAGDFKDLSLSSISPLSAANLNNLAQSASQSLSNLIDGLAISEDLKSELRGLNALKTQNGFKIGFPILNDPAGVVFNLLLGRDSDLFFFEAKATAELAGTEATNLSFFGQPIEFFGHVDIDTQMRFGYDTFGLRQLIANLAAGDASHIVSDITDGFYVNSDSYFKMAGAIGAGWGASVLNVFPVSISGGFYTQNSGLDPVHVYIEDPNADGKLRFNEFHLGLDNKPAAFKLTGELAAELNVEVGFPDPDPLDVLPAPPNKKLSVAREVLIRFATLTPSRLASEPDANGEVTLFLGTNAHQRAVGQNRDDGDEKFIIEHVRTNPNGSEDIKVRAFGINQEIKNVRKIKATDQVGTLTIIVQPGVTSNVDFDGGQGAAFLTYHGSGAASLTGGLLGSTLVGGNGPSILTGGAGDDTIILGSHTNTVDAAGGHNTVILSAPIYHPSTISGGTGLDNELQIIANATTTGITAFPVGSSVDVGIINGFGQTPVHLSFSHFDTVTIDASFSPTNFTLGDLAAAGVQLLTIDATTPYQSARQIDLDTRVSNGAADVTIRDYVSPGKPGAEILNATTGLTTRLLGFHSDDTLTLRHHGGSITVEPLDFTDGHFVFDTSARAGNVPDVINITTPARDNGHLIVKELFRDVLITLTDYSTFLIKGDIAADQLNLNVAAASSGANTVDIDAHSVHGELNVNLLGGATAINHVTLSRAGLEADVSIFGQNTTTDLLLGVGQLALIRHDVFASNVKLTVDNDESMLASILTLDATSFGTWNIPTLSGVTPELTFSNLRGEMTVHAGAADRFQLDVTPASINRLTIDNRSMTSQDSVYTSNWSVPLRLLGNFSFYAGRVLHRDGTVERVKRLANVNSTVTFDYFFRESISSALYPTGPSEVVFDGDLDPAGAHYTISGNSTSGSNLVVNDTVGLSVSVRGYSQDDQFYIYMPGATVDANLTQGPDATFYLDGQARLAGTHPTAPNDITILSRAGSTTMTPLGQFNSLLDMFNDVYVLGALPQDSLDVTVPTTFKMASTLTGTNQIRFDYALNGAAGFTVTSPTARYTVHSTVAQLPNTPLNPNPLDVTPQPITPITSFADRAVMYTDLTKSPLEAEKIAIRGNTIPWSFNVNGVVVTIPVEVIVNLQIYPVNPNPIATDNHVNIDASQLRGTFGFQVSEPDYAYAELLTDGVARGGGAPATNFGQTYATISHTHTQLATTITGTLPITGQRVNTIGAFAGGYITRAPGMQVTVGTGDLSTLQGNLTVNQGWLKEVDNRNAAFANIIQLTPSGVSWNAGDGGRTSLALSNLHGKMTVTGSAVDRFAVEGTPNSAYRTVLRNFSTAATPSGVYVMGKNVMPLEVSGNFDLAVGRRLNLNGTVTNVGTILGVADDTKTYTQTGGHINFVNVWQDFAIRPTNTTSIAGPLTWFDPAWYLQGNGPRPQLPIYYNYSGPGEGMFVFDASNDTVTDRVLGDMIVQNGGGALNGISSNSNYAGKAHFRFYQSEVIYGANTDVYWYGAKLRSTTGAFNPMAPTLFNNVLNGAVRYFANPANVGENPIEQILIGNALAPVYIEGSGRNTRVEINPLFSLPTSYAMAFFDSSISTGEVLIHLGWGGGHTGGYSLIDTIQADVSVSSAALRVIGDIPRPVGSPPVTSRPSVTIGGSSMTGIATGTIHYANLADSVLPGTFTFNSSLDLNPLRFPGLNVQLPTHFPVDATVQNTPTGATTHITTVLSSANNTHTNGVLNVLGTTGKLILGDMYGVLPTNGDKFNWPGRAGNISTSWSDGISFSQINIGNGSLAGIQGAILLKGDSHTTTTTVTNINGRNDAARSNVVFTRPAYPLNPFPTQFVPYQQVDGLASVPIYFGQFYQQTHPLNIYGSSGSTYNVASGPVDMKLYQGVGSNTTIRTTPLTVVGGNLVTLLMPNGLTVPSYVGVPEIYVQQDAANPAPISIVVEKENTFSNANLRLESTGNGMMRLKDTFVLSPFTEYWRLNYKGSDATISVNYGTITVADTGSLGTTVSSKAPAVNVHGTTGDLKILPVGTATGNALITLGNNGNMQAILGDVEITPNPTAGPGTADNRNDAGHRNIHMSANGSMFTVTGMAPGTIKYTTQFGPTFYGGTGGSTFFLDNMPTFSNFMNVNGGSPTNDILVGANVTNTWNLTGPNSGQLNSKIAFTGIGNLRGGSGDDTFRFLFISFNNSNGSLTGGIDGGPGADTLFYEFSSWWHNVAYDLSQGTAPLVAGFTTDIERAPFDLLSPGTRVNTVGEAIAPFTVGRYGGPLNVTYSATGLPPGLTLDSNTGLITGTIPQSASNGSYSVHVTATDGFYLTACDFLWTVVDLSTLEAISLSDPSLGPLPNDGSYLDQSRRVVSADGRFVAYYSGATNLVPGDTNNKDDVFVRDRQTGMTTLVSGGISGPGNSHSAEPSISADGRYVAFYSQSNNLVPGGTNGYQVFVRDMQNGATSLVSSGLNGPGNGASYSPTISPDGRYVAFVSYASNLVPDAVNGFSQVFVRDLQTGTTALVNTGSNGIGNGQSFDAPAISGDGRYVAFTSDSTNLVPGGTNGTQVFVRDLQAGSTTLVSIGVGGQSNQSCFGVSISADGRHVAFDTRASNLVAQPTNSLSNVYISDWQNGTILLVSVGSDGQIGNTGSYDATISASGRYVAFDSKSSNFAIGDTNGSADVFLRDLQSGITKRISVGPAGQGDMDSICPSISADGRSVVFLSYANNLVTNFNVREDIYLYNNSLAVADFGLIDPGTIVSGAGVAVSVQIQSVGSPPNVVYTATNLPDGLSIDSQTGLITGTIHRYASYPQYFSTEVSVSDGISTHSTTFDWKITTSTFELSPASIPENSAGGTVVGDLLPVNPPVARTFTYSLTNDAGGRFALNGTQLVVASGAAFDYEQNTSHDITIEIEDSLHNISLQTFTVIVTDINEAPTAATLTSVVSTLQEDTSTAAAIRLADIGVTDDALGQNVLSLSGPDASFFRIINNRLFLKAGVRLNFAAKPTYNVTVNVDDSMVGGSPDASVSFTLNLTSTAPTMVTTPTPTQDMTPTITWSAIPGAVSYDVWITNLSTNTVLPTQTVTGTSYTPTADLGIGRFRVWVRSQNAAGVKSRWSAPHTFVINTAVTLNPIVLRQITPRPQISWQSLPGAARYEIWVSSMTGSGFVHRDATITGTSWTPSIDLAVDRYRAWVRGFSADGIQGTWSREIVMIVVPAPTMVSTPTPTQDLTPTISWSAIPGAVSYDVWITNVSTNTSLATQTVTGKSYTPTNDLGIGRFRVWVRLQSAAGVKSPWSAPHTFEINTAVTLDPIVRRQNTPRPQISWQSLPGATRYEIYVSSPTVSGFLHRDATITGTSWTPSSDLAIGRYQAWVRGFSVDGIPAAWSREISMIADVIVVPAPSLISPLHATFDRTPTFSWTSVSGAAQYVVRVRNANDGTVVVNATVMAPATTFTPLTELPSNLYYNWEVRAVGPVGHQSDFSPANRLFIGGRPVIFGPTGTAGSRTPTFSWSAVQDASRYELRVDRTDVVQNRLIEKSDLTTNSYTPSTALAAGTYRFWVRAVSTTNETSSWSLISNFTVVSVAPDRNQPLANVPDALILTGLPMPSLQAATQQGDPNDASHTIAPTRGQHTTTKESDQPAKLDHNRSGDRINVASSIERRSMPVTDSVAFEGSQLITRESGDLLIDELMSSHDLAWLP